MDTNESSARAPTENARASRSKQVPERIDVAVIGGGQAGLVIGYFLGRQGRPFVILEAGASIGEAWRTRWNSLVLFTSRRFSGLAGRPFPGDPEGYATRDEVLAYLEQYAATFDLPVQLETPVRRLSPAAGGFDLELDDGLIEADQVVVATGPFQVPRIPLVADQLASEVFQVHSTGYMEPSDVPAGTVVVVGGGNTGYQIAEELSRFAGSTSPLDLGRRHCRSGFWDVISSGGSLRSASSTRPLIRGLDSGCSSEKTR